MIFIPFNNFDFYPGNNLIHIFIPVLGKTPKGSSAGTPNPYSSVVQSLQLAHANNTTVRSFTTPSFLPRPHCFTHVLHFNKDHRLPFAISSQTQRRAVGQAKTKAHRIN